MPGPFRFASLATRVVESEVSARAPGRESPVGVVVLRRSKDNASVGVAAEGDGRPDCLHDPERPNPSQERVHARKRAAECEREHETVAAALQGVHEHHEGDGGSAECGEHRPECARLLRDESGNAWHQCRLNPSQECPQKVERGPLIVALTRQCCERQLPGTEGTRCWRRPWPNRLRRPRLREPAGA